MIMAALDLYSFELLGTSHGNTRPIQIGGSNSNGAGMRYEHEDGDPSNAGLHHARVFRELVKATHVG